MFPFVDAIMPEKMFPFVDAIMPIRVVYIDFGNKDRV